MVTLGSARATANEPEQQVGGAYGVALYEPWSRAHLHPPLVLKLRAHILLRTISHNDNCAEQLAAIRRGPGAHPEEEEFIEYLLEEKTIAGASTLRTLRLRTRPELPATRECDQEYIHAAWIDYAARVYQRLVGQDGLQTEGICTTLCLYDPFASPLICMLDDSPYVSVYRKRRCAAASMRTSSAGSSDANSHQGTTRSRQWSDVYKGRTTANGRSHKKSTS